MYNSKNPWYLPPPQGYSLSSKPHGISNLSSEYHTAPYLKHLKNHIQQRIPKPEEEGGGNAF